MECTNHFSTAVVKAPEIFFNSLETICKMICLLFAIKVPSAAAQMIDQISVTLGQLKYTWVFLILKQLRIIRQVFYYN